MQMSKIATSCSNTANITTNLIWFKDWKLLTCLIQKLIQWMTQNEDLDVFFLFFFLMNAGTYQVERLTIWFNFMFFHIFDKAAVGIPREGKKMWNL